MAVQDLTVDAVLASFPELEAARLLAPGQGNQKVGFYAEHEGVPVALFLVPFNDPDCPMDPEDVVEVRGRLQREVDTLAAINSPHVPRLGPLPLGTRMVAGVECGYFTEEYIDGTCLTDLLRTGGTLELGEAVEMALGIARAIREFERLKRVHRDIKPANIIRRSQGIYVLVDPGLVLDLDGPELTKSKALPGTLMYMSPEQVDLDSKRDLDFRSDAYSLAVVLYRALSGQHPYGRSSYGIVEWIRCIKLDSPAQAAQVPADVRPLWDLVMRLLKKRPHQRFLSTPDRLVDEILTIQGALT